MPGWSELVKKIWEALKEKKDGRSSAEDVASGKTGVDSGDRVAPAMILDKGKGLVCPVQAIKETVGLIAAEVKTSVRL